MLVPDSDATKALRALTRAREDLVGHRVALANELRAQLECFWPGAAQIFADVDSPIALAFLKRYPAPIDAHGLGEQRLARFLARHHYCGRRTADELLGRLRGAASGRAGTLETEARRQVVLALVAALEPIVAQIAQLTSEIRSALARPRRRARPSDRCSATPRPPICPATILAEMGDCRARYPTKAALAGDSGQAPVAIESGKSKRARFRWACDHRLRDAIATLADTSRHTNPWAADIYTRARPAAAPTNTRSASSAAPGTAVIWRMWHDHSTYDPTHTRQPSSSSSSHRRLTQGVSQAQLLADLVAVKARLLELADEHAGVLG